MLFRRSILMLIAVCTMMSLAALAADKEKKYSVATVQSVERVPAPNSNYGSERGVMADVDTYRITTELDGKKYVVEYQTLGDPQRDVSWLVGKKYEAYVEGRTMVLRSQAGRVMTLPIVSSGP
jgi:hypothetical protein